LRFLLWLACTVAYAVTQYFVGRLWRLSAFEMHVGRFYAPPRLISIVFGVYNCIYIFAAVLIATWLSAIWLRQVTGRYVIMIAAVVPILLFMQIMRLLGESGAVVSLDELLYNLLATIVAAHFAITVALRFARAHPLFGR
jgi:hypothetical protein